MDEVVQFRPERRVVTMQVVVYLLALAVMIPLLSYVVRDERWLALIPGVLLLALVVVVVRGTLRMRVELEPSDIRVVGLMRTWVVPRERVITMNGPVSAPCLSWRDEKGHERTALVYALHHRGVMEWFAPGAGRRREQFIDRVNHWVAAT